MLVDSDGCESKTALKHSSRSILATTLHPGEPVPVTQMPMTKFMVQSSTSGTW